MTRGESGSARILVWLSLAAALARLSGPPDEIPGSGAQPSPARLCRGGSAGGRKLRVTAPRLRPEDDSVESIVVTSTKFNTDAAPAKASLETTEPQTVINRSYIENFVPPQADYVTILAIVPSLTGGDSNGAGLSDGGAKNTLRGLPDGDFVMQYDGIPFGDTNGPTHHNISYFPASTIGSIDVDRGPGNAANLGAATYGGTVKLFSEALTADPQASAAISYGSFNTALGVLNAQSGDLDFLGHDAESCSTCKGLVRSNGALTQQNVDTENAVLKVESRIAPQWTLTLFGDYSYLKEHLDDNNGLTPAQVAVYGKDFALQNTDPNLPTYYAYNYTSKQTDIEYFRVRAARSSTASNSTTRFIPTPIGTTRSARTARPRRSLKSTPIRLRTTQR